MIDPLSFEHVCALISESNGPILILKLLSSWFSNSANSRKKANNEEMGEDDDLCGVAWLEARLPNSDLW